MHLHGDLPHLLRELVADEAVRFVLDNIAAAGRVGRLDRDLGDQLDEFPPRVRLKEFDSTTRADPNVPDGRVKKGTEPEQVLAEHAHHSDGREKRSLGRVLLTEGRREGEHSSGSCQVREQPGCFVQRIWAHQISFFVPRLRDIASPGSDSTPSLFRTGPIYNGR